MATTDRQATTPALAHALSAAERGLAALVALLVDAALNTGLAEREAGAAIASAARMTGRRP